MYAYQQNFTNLETMIQFLGTQLLAHGFVLAAVNGNSAAANISGAATDIVVNAASGVDSRSSTEPWSIKLRANDAEGWVAINILPTSQMSNFDPPQSDLPNYTPAKGDTTEHKLEAGRVSVNSDSARYFIHRTNGWNLTSLDGSGNPISVYLAISDHGISLCCWAEDQLDSGRCSSWLVAQRGVQQSNLQLPSYKSPVICIFQTESSGDASTLTPESIQRFIVIEDDISAATAPVSAVIAQPDVFPILNPLQQVTFTPDNNVIVLFPQLYNTSRHIYFLVLDMMAYTSADAVSMSSTVPVAFSIGTKNYFALTANGDLNTGMRILLPMS